MPQVRPAALVRAVEIPATTTLSDTSVDLINQVPTRTTARGPGFGYKDVLARVVFVPAVARKASRASVAVPMLTGLCGNWQS